MHPKALSTRIRIRIFLNRIGPHRTRNVITKKPQLPEICSFFCFVLFFLFVSDGFANSCRRLLKMLKMLGMNVICILRLFPQESGYDNGQFIN